MYGGTAKATVAELQVLGGFELRVAGRAAPLPLHAQRVLGCLAVAGTVQRREVLAGRLWGESSQDRAQGNLRNALWRVRQAGPGVVEATREAVRLGDGVEVDLALSERWAHRLVASDAPAPPEPPPLGLLGRDLLPAWDEEWVVLERERVRQLRLHALEALSRTLTGDRRFAEAVEAALTAVMADPLRESANAALIEAHMAEGNPSEAARQLAAYRAVLADQLGLEPSSDLEDLVAAAAGPVRDGQRTRRQTLR